MEKFYKIICSNGFSTCDEEFYVKANETDICEITDDILCNQYSFFEPDDRFCDMDNEDEIGEYQEDCIAEYIEISEEEFLENNGEEY